MKKPKSFALLVAATMAGCAAGSMVKCDTTQGEFIVRVHPEWAPLGAERFLKMVDEGFFDHLPVYRAVAGFLAQFGSSVNRETTAKWEEIGPIKDDPFIGIQDPYFKRGMMAFAGYAENTRSTQVFIGYNDNPNLGRSAWGQPFAQVESGMEVVDAFYTGYGDLGQFGGSAPDPNRIEREGGAFLATSHPNLDYIESCARMAGTDDTSSPSSPMFSCSASSCNKALANEQTGEVECLCHWSCLVSDSCCLRFQEACPSDYELATGYQKQQSEQVSAGAEEPSPSSAKKMKKNKRKSGKKKKNKKKTKKKSKQNGP